jgi:hypothetical protein
MVDALPIADIYHTDGFVGYLAVDFWGRHNRNIHNKKDTHIIESTNSDIRTYIAGFARKSRCFYRSLETARAVVALFVNAYNRFGEAKQKFYTNPQSIVRHKNPIPKSRLHKFRDAPFSLFDFVLAT